MIEGFERTGTPFRNSGRPILGYRIQAFQMERQRQEHHIQKSEVLPYTPAQVYSLVADVARYSEFLPWCKGSWVTKEDDGKVIAELTVGYGPVQASFTTRNRYQPGKEIRMALVEGPFRRLQGAWHFRSERGEKTRITLDLRFQFADHGLGKLFDSAFKTAMERILDAFMERARSLYGSTGTV